MSDEKINVYEVFKHYGGDEYKSLINKGEIDGMDFLIGKIGDINKLTAGMAGFGAERSQRVIIDFDKDYGYFIAKRIFMDYGAL